MSGAARGGRSGIAVYVVVCALVPLVLDAGTGRLLGEALLMLAMAQMWNLLAGYTGLVSIGHQVFVGVGAYALFVGSDTLGISPYAAIPLAGLAGGLLALLIAPLLFRLRDAYFSIGMWVFAEILRLLVTKSSTFGGTSGTGAQVRAADRRRTLRPAELLYLRGHRAGGDGRNACAVAVAVRPGIDDGAGQ